MLFPVAQWRGLAAAATSIQRYSCIEVDANPVVRLVWTYVVGPFVSFLPQRWRKCVAPNDQIEWEPATLLSGVVQSLAALAALIYWYSYSLTHWAQQAIFATVKAHPQASIPGNTVGFAALVLVALHPLTWIVVCFGIEGVVRVLGAASTGSVLGTFPVYALDRLIAFLWRSSKAEGGNQE